MQTPTNSSLREMRKAAGKTQQEVAQALRISQGAYANIELGRRRPSPEIATRLHSFFCGTISREQILYPDEYTACQNGNPSVTDGGKQ